MALEGKRVALLVEDGYNLDEFVYPYHRLKEAGAEVKVVGPSRTDTFTSHDRDVKADLPADRAKVEDFDAVIIPGGQAPDRMRLDKDLVQFVHDMDGAGKPVGAICHAGSMLVSAKVLAGRNATSYYSIRDDMEAAGATWSDQEVVVDHNLVTSRTPADLPAFCRTIIEAMERQPATV
jgi:protease I